MALRRTHRYPKRRNSEDHISANQSHLRRTSRTLLSMYGAIGVQLMNQSGRMSIRVRGLFQVPIVFFLLKPNFTAENYTKLCTIEVNNLSQLPLIPQKRIGGTSTYYRLDYDIVLLFGLTELKAFVAWKDHVSIPLTFAMGFYWLAKNCSNTGPRSEVRNCPLNGGRRWTLTCTNGYFKGA